jgi:hypothetical protein
MASRLQYDLCPETGVGCVLVTREQGLLKIDLMPDEAVSLKQLVSSGDFAGARELLLSVDSAAAELDETALRALAQEMR